MKTLTNSQARRFMLLKHGLFGEHKFIGKQGILEFIRQAGCIQYDPVDLCGRNADIALLSRVKGYTKEMLDELLYKDRRLIDHFDKNLSIFAVEDIPAIFNKKPGGGYAEAFDSRGGEAVERVIPQIRRLIAERGHISAAEAAESGIDETIEWLWSIMASLPRAALESMYFRGELIVHHKSGVNKSYAFMKDYIAGEILNAPPPFNSDNERLAWHIKRRIGAVGMLWNRASDAWLGLSIKTPERNAAFEKLLGEDMIFEVMVEDMKSPLYIRGEDKEIMDAALSGEDLPPRCEFIAPLDSIIWDRKLIRALFGFEYSWEIYTPAAKRKYGAYVMPILYGERFAGRVEAVCDRKNKTLFVKNIWYEDSTKQTGKLHAAVENCLKRFAKFNGCINVRG